MGVYRACNNLDVPEWAPRGSEPSLPVLGLIARESAGLIPAEFFRCNNAHLLFWLSLTPIATIWMGENISYSLPIAICGVLQLACAVAFLILSRELSYLHGPESEIAKALGTGKKNYPRF